MSLDLPSARLVGFADTLRAAGFAASTDLAISFLAATQALGPRSLDDIRRAARAVFGPAPERRGEFEALFDAHFLGRNRVVQTSEDTEDDSPQEGATPPDGAAEPSDSPGPTASVDRVAHRREVAPADDDLALRHFARVAPRRLPERLTRRWSPAPNGRTYDRQRILRAAARRGGEVLDLPMRKRQRRLRPVLLLVDVSGSMKEHSDSVLRLAHTLVRLPTRVEVFSLGTDLTRLTPALKLRSEAQALSRVGAMIPDFDGGTRLGETLGQLLRTPRLAAFARGAIVVTVSDGLEIGDSDALTAAARKLHHLAFAHLWLTPLATGPGFTPQTEALTRIAPFIDEFGSARSIAHICAHLLGAPLTEEAA
ncbi:MAG: VWA domain-containing protein [Paracoccaceae bacterium]|nr:VWA domain-containing protein [Paracoccaceae bacterium]